MQKSTLPQGVKCLMSWADKGTLTFDNPVQRAGSQWNLLQKSLLIHSLLANYPVPNVYLLKSKNEEGSTVYDCLDAKQRLTSVFEFIRGDYELHSATPEVELEGTIYDLANMKFEDLSEECQDAILGYRFSIYCIEDATEEEVEEIFRRLNNSTPLSPIQKCRSVMGTDLARWTREMSQTSFMQHAVSLTVSQLRKEADLEVILQAMLLLDSRHEGYEWKGISTGEVTKYCSYIRGKYNDDKRIMLMEIIEYLSNAFTDKHKFLKKSNIPTVIVLAKLALENNISKEDFKRFIDSFSNTVCPQYEANQGSGNVKRIKTEGRLVAIAVAFSDYFDLDNINILSVGEPVGSITDNSDNPEQEYKELAENEEFDSDSVSIEEETEPTEDFSEAESEEESLTYEATVSEGEDWDGGEQD